MVPAATGCLTCPGGSIPPETPPGANGVPNPTMSWDDDPDLMSGNDGSELPKTSLLGDLRKGDSFTLTFRDEGETVERQHGKAVHFPVELDALDGYAETWGDEEVEVGEAYSFETSSSRLLGALAEHKPLDGKTVQVHVDGTGYDAAYTVKEVED